MRLRDGSEPMDYRCPTPCDGDCEATCHEAHLPSWKREHVVERCEAGEFVFQAPNAANVIFRNGAVVRAPQTYAS